MKERDCANCKHHTEDGCSSWDCEFEAKDLISRADAIEAVRKKLQDWGSYAFEDYRRGLYEAQDIIEALPSADAVQGEWEKTTDGNGWNEWHVLKCPLCDATIEDKQNRKWEYNYCPNCGARMTPYKGGAE